MDSPVRIRKVMSANLAMAQRASQQHGAHEQYQPDIYSFLGPVNWQRNESIGNGGSGGGGNLRVPTQISGSATDTIVVVERNLLKG